MNNSEPSLEGCRAKLDRAQEHLDALAAETLDFLRTQPYELRPRIDIKAGRYSVKIKIKRQPPERLGLIVGDAVQNLRAALDHLVCNLAFLGGGEEADRNQFPILQSPPTDRRSRDKWERMLSNVPPGARAVIAQLQPYNRPEGVEIAKHPLWVVQRLSNEDKHRVVLRAMAHVLDAETAPFDAIPTFEPIADVSKPKNLKFGSLGPLDSEAELFSADVEILGPRPELRMKGTLPIDTIYGKDLVPNRRLDIASTKIREIVESFAPAFTGKAPQEGGYAIPSPEQFPHS